MNTMNNRVAGMSLAHRSLTIALAGLLLLSATAGAQALCGDCNLDNRVDVLDALRAAQLGAGLGGVQGPCCDVSAPGGPPPDGTVNVLDALFIAQFSAGILPALRCLCNNYGYAVRSDNMVFTYSLRPSVNQLSIRNVTPEPPGNRLLAVRRDLTEAWTTINGATMTGYDTVTCNPVTGTMNGGVLHPFPAPPPGQTVSTLAADEQIGTATAFLAAHQGTPPRLEYHTGPTFVDSEPAGETLVGLSSVPGSLFMLGIGPGPVPPGLSGVSRFFLSAGMVPAGCTRMGPLVGNCTLESFPNAFLPFNDIETTTTGDAVFVSGSVIALPTVHMFNPEEVGLSTLASFPGGFPGTNLAIDSARQRGWMVIGTGAIADFTYTPPTTSMPGTPGMAGMITPNPVPTPIPGTIVDIAFNQATDTLSVASTNTIAVFDVSTTAAPTIMIGSFTVPAGMIESIGTY